MKEGLTHVRRNPETTWCGLKAPDFRSSISLQMLAETDSGAVPPLADCIEICEWCTKKARVLIQSMRALTKDNLA